MTSSARTRERGDCLARRRLITRLLLLHLLTISNSASTLEIADHCWVLNQDAKLCCYRMSTNEGVYIGPPVTSSATAGPTQDAIFIYRYLDADSGPTTLIEHEHPIPSFLCQPNALQDSSQAAEVFKTLVNEVNDETHMECMLLMSAPCFSCGRPPMDAIKFPIPCLDWSPPLVTVTVMPVCGMEVCERKVKRLLDGRQKERRRADERSDEHANETTPTQNRVDAKSGCTTCGKEAAARPCTKCGKVKYCNRACQRKDMKSHEVDCH